MRRSLSLRMIPVILLGSTAIAYVLARPGLAARVPHLAIWEFPVGALLVTILLWAALATRRDLTPLVPWRRHEQIVRALPDPALRADLTTLERWVETGDDPNAVADVVARARTKDRHEQDRVRAELAQILPTLHSRRKRGSALQHELEHGA